MLLDSILCIPMKNSHKWPTDIWSKDKGMKMHFLCKMLIYKNIYGKIAKLDQDHSKYFNIKLLEINHPLVIIDMLPKIHIICIIF